MSEGSEIVVIRKGEKNYSVEINEDLEEIWLSVAMLIDGAIKLLTKHDIPKEKARETVWAACRVGLEMPGNLGKVVSEEGQA